MGIQEFLTNSQKYFCTFQLFIVATKITNFGSQQHNLYSIMRISGMLFNIYSVCSVECNRACRPEGTHNASVCGKVAILKEIEMEKGEGCG